MMLKEMNECDLPDERCLNFGPELLTNDELLASILRTGTKENDALMLAHKILNPDSQYEGLMALNHISAKDIGKIKGIGKAKVVQLMCIAELNRRMCKEKRRTGFSVTSPESVASYFMEDMRHLETEQINLILINSKSKVIKELVLSTGTVNASILSPREVFISALQYSAVNIILLHNHPSGDPSPSTEDISTTKRIKEAGVVVGVKLLDHIIIGDNKYISLKEIGLL